MRTKKYIFLTAVIAIIILLITNTKAQEEKRSFDELLNTLKTGNAYQRNRAINPFSKIDDPRVVPVLMELINDNDETVRINSIQALAYISDKRSVPALVKALNDKNSEIRRYAAMGIVRNGDQNNITDLVTSVINNMPLSSPALEAISKMSPKAPPEIIGILDKVNDENINKHYRWVPFFADLANCLAIIGDKAAYQPLKKAQASIEKNFYDYSLWYAVKKALAAIEPEKEPFDRPAADILNSIHHYKMIPEAIKEKWITSLSELGNSAIEDLRWVLKFSDNSDYTRTMIATEVLGEIGGTTAAEILEKHITEIDSSNQSYLYKTSFVNLLKADPNIQNIETIIRYSDQLDKHLQQNQVDEIFALEKVPLEIKIAYFEALKYDTQDKYTLKYYAATCLINFLAKEGGKEAGKYLSDILLDTTVDNRIRIQAANALSNIKDYDSISSLKKAYETSNLSSGVIAKALATMKNERAIPILKDLANGNMLNHQGRLWIAAALAKYDIDYYENAKIIREALPDSFEQAQCLNDNETVDSIAAYIKEGKPDSEEALNTLVAIGTEYALEVIKSKIDLENITNLDYLKKLHEAAAEIANNLNEESIQYYKDAISVTNTVSGWFPIGQYQVKPFDQKENSDLLKEHSSLVRKIWITKTTEYFDNINDEVEWSYGIYSGLRAIPDYFDDELIPLLERITKEDQSTGSIAGKDSWIKYYSNRSMAAKILSDNTGKEYTFVDIDGRTHPGGWTPSEEQ